jgi:DNA polymerase IV
MFDTSSNRVRDADRGPSILHADLDAFYASVEQLLRPELRGKPIAVGGGVVLACSYEAKRFGVGSGMSGSQARRLCPGLQFVDGHFKEYQRLGDAVMEVLGDFTPMVQRISIDEAFIDVTGSVHLFGPPESIGAQIRRGPSTSPRSLHRWPNRMAWWSCTRIARSSSCIHCRLG